MAAKKSEAKKSLKPKINFDIETYANKAILADNRTLTKELNTVRKELEAAKAAHINATNKAIEENEKSSEEALKIYVSKLIEIEKIYDSKEAKKLLNCVTQFNDAVTALGSASVLYSKSYVKVAGKKSIKLLTMQQIGKLIEALDNMDWVIKAYTNRKVINNLEKAIEKYQLKVRSIKNR